VVDDGTGPTLPTAESGEPARAEGELLGGRYRLGKHLGHGGMGDVYEAEDLALNETIALKRLRASDARSIARLRREVQLARKVTHPGVCRVFDLGVEGQLPFITMELLRGETLSARIQRGRLTIADALPIAKQLAAALDAAHQAEVVHRDFKCGNVILVGDRAVVTDFGLALDLDQESHPEIRETGAATLVGSPAYMAPEQVEGAPVDAASDLYALGVVLFEMVTGGLPFAEPTPMATAMRRLKVPAPRARTRVFDLDARWDDAIAACLERDPARRPRSAGALVAMLEGRRRIRVGWRVPVAVAAAGLAAAVAVIARPRAHAGRRPVRTIAIARATGCGYDGPIELTVWDDRRAFARAAAAPLVTIGFDDLRDGGDAPVPFDADRYVSDGILIHGEGGQYAIGSRIWPLDLHPTSPPNSYAPGPIGPENTISGGFNTDVDFAGGGCVAAFGNFYLDADNRAQTGWTAYDASGRWLGTEADLRGGDGSQLFRGIVALDPHHRPVAVPARIHLINGDAWIGSGAGEGVSLDDLSFTAPTR
jgi:hypothetical protein